MSDPLTKLSNKYGCDKSDRRHKYTRRYHQYFQHMRNIEFDMIELGFGKGNSVKMWLEYFTKARLISVDIMKELPNDKMINDYVKNGRLKFISADQINIGKIIKTLKNYKEFFLIVDDASHVPEDQQYTLAKLFPYVSKDGFYVIEDLKCKRKHSTRFSCKGEKTLKVLDYYILFYQ